MINNHDELGGLKTMDVAKDNTTALLNERASQEYESVTSPEITGRAVIANTGDLDGT